jgi:hypothetical protein
VVVIDDFLREEDLRGHFYREIGDRRLHCVLLHPGLATALERNRARNNKTFDTKKLEPIIHRLAKVVTAEVDGWIVVDNSGLTVEETVNRIIELSDRVGSPATA